jgi:hypothetical protein
MKGEEMFLQNPKILYSLPTYIPAYYVERGQCAPEEEEWAFLLFFFFVFFSFSF